MDLDRAEKWSGGYTLDAFELTGELLRSGSEWRKAPTFRLTVESWPPRNQQPREYY